MQKGIFRAFKQGNSNIFFFFLLSLFVTLFVPFKSRAGHSTSHYVDWSVGRSLYVLAFLSSNR